MSVYSYRGMGDTFLVRQARRALDTRTCDAFEKMLIHMSTTTLYTRAINVFTSHTTMTGGDEQAALGAYLMPPPGTAHRRRSACHCPRRPRPSSPAGASRRPRALGPARRARLAQRRR